MRPCTVRSAPIAREGNAAHRSGAGSRSTERQHGPHERALQRLTGSGQGLVHVMKGDVFWADGTRCLVSWRNAAALRALPNSRIPDVESETYHVMRDPVLPTSRRK